MTPADDIPAKTRPAIDKKALLEKYVAERDKRLRADGNDQYLRLEGQLSHYLDDPYTPFVEREPLADHVTFAFVGGGFAGLVTGARLVEAGYRLEAARPVGQFVWSTHVELASLFVRQPG